jgi:hypothetical protein
MDNTAQQSYNHMVDGDRRSLLNDNKGDLNTGYGICMALIGGISFYIAIYFLFF